MILRSAQHVRLMTKTSSRSRSRSHSDRAPPPPSSSGSTRPLLPTYSGDSTARSPIVMTTSLWVEEADLPMQPLSWGRATGPPLVHLCRRAKESPKDNTITFFFSLGTDENLFSRTPNTVVWKRLFGMNQMNERLVESDASPSGEETPTKAIWNVNDRQLPHLLCKSIRNQLHYSPVQSIKNQKELDCQGCSIKLYIVYCNFDRAICWLPSIG